jgi:hypothetical protein
MKTGLMFAAVAACGSVGALWQVRDASDSPHASALFEGRNEFGTGSTIPIAWGDHDNDGDLDLAIGNFFNQANKLYEGGGDGTFTTNDAFGAASTFAAVWGDYDNDGDLDLAVGNDGTNRLYENTGGGSFTGRDVFGGFRTVALAWGDCDNDGDLDMAVGNGILGTAQRNFLFVNNGDGTFTLTAQFGMGQTDSLAWGDFDRDGDLDLAVGNGGFGYVGQNFLYVNNGDGSFTEREEFGMGDTAVVAWGDVNGDGWLDLAVGNWANGQDLLYINNGDGTFTERPAFGARDANTLTWGDFDLDGDLDLAVGNGDFTTADQNYLYVNQGDGTFTEVAEFGMGSTDSLAWGDVDGDGDLDMAVGNEHSPTQNWLYVNLLPPTGYLRLDLEGRFHAFGPPFSNRSAVGAAVSVFEAGHLGDPAYRLGFQQVEAKGGFSAQNAMALTFGTPGRSHVDVEIRWPGSGSRAIVQGLAYVAASGARRVVEAMPGDFDDDGDVELDDHTAFWLCLTGPCPDPVCDPPLYEPACAAADANADGDVDLGDFASIQLWLAASP